MPKGGCLVGSCGCLIFGLILGALAVWLLIPRLQERGLTPDQAAATVEIKLEKISGEVDEVRDKASAFKESVQSKMPVSGNAPASK